MNSSAASLASALPPSRAERSIVDGARDDCDIKCWRRISSSTMPRARITAQHDPDLDPVDALQPPPNTKTRVGKAILRPRLAPGPSAATSVGPSGVTDTNGQRRRVPLTSAVPEHASRDFYPVALFTWQMAYQQSHAFDYYRRFVVRYHATRMHHDRIA